MQTEAKALVFWGSDSNMAAKHPKERAAALLKVAMNAIEIAIEQDEAAGMSYLVLANSTD